MNKQKVLYLQLPRLDNDIKSPDENVHLAEVYLKTALDMSGEQKYYSNVGALRESPLQQCEDTLDDKHLLQNILKTKPSIICATLYLWNIERTLGLLAKIKQFLPDVKVLIGGPEVEKGHPFLYKSKAWDYAVSGDGENVFLKVLQAIRTGKPINASKIKKEPCELKKLIPYINKNYYRPTGKGIAWLETVRGCPLKCTFCAYGHNRPRLSYLNPSETAESILVLQDKGAKEIRFIDPTFNANPCFKEILKHIAKVNKNKKLKFFAELRPDTLTKEDATMLAEANVSSIEVGVQSRNPETLKLIRRPTDIGRTEQGISYLTEAGIYTTIDLMFGLPGQTLEDIRKMLGWASKFKNTYVQCLQTLLLPGTQIRQDAKKYGMAALPLPPYSVTSTDTLSQLDILQAERIARNYLNIDMDTQTLQFAGRKLPDLFPEKITYVAGNVSEHFVIKGKTNRRAMIFKGKCLFEHRDRIIHFIDECIKTEPHILWQFVFEPDIEEPLELIDMAVLAIRKHPFHVQDRFMHVHSPGKICSRRIFFLLNPSKDYSPSWRNTVECELRKVFI